MKNNKVENQIQEVLDALDLSNVSRRMILRVPCVASGMLDAGTVCTAALRERTAKP